MKVAICKYCHSGNVEPFNRVGKVYDYYCRTCQKTFSVIEEQRRKDDKKVIVLNTKGSRK